MGNSKDANGRKFPFVPILGILATLVVGYLGYLGVTGSTRMAIDATRNAEATLTEAARLIMINEAPKQTLTKQTEIEGTRNAEASLTETENQSHEDSPTTISLTDTPMDTPMHTPSPVPPPDTPSPTYTPTPEVIQINTDQDTGEIVCYYDPCEGQGHWPQIMVNSEMCLEFGCHPWRGVFHFDLSEIPRESEIVSAVVYFYMISVDEGISEVAIQRMLIPWDEETTYLAWSDNKLDCDPMNNITSAEIKEGWNHWDVSQIIEYQHSYQADNYGLCLMPYDDDPDDDYGINISSKEGPSNQRPYLLVKYYPPD